MNYYWTVDIGTGDYSYWETTYGLADFAIKMKEYYEDKPFDYGMTIEATFKRHQ